MTKTLTKALLASHRDRKPIRLFRSDLEDGWIDGYVVQISSTLTLLQIFKDAGLDGFLCIEDRDVDEYQYPAPYADFLERHLKLRKVSGGEHTSYDLSSWASLMASASKDFPLLTYTPRKESDICFIGELSEQNNDSFTFKTITPNGEWGEFDSYSISDISSISFGGAYENALIAVARSRS